MTQTAPKRVTAAQTRRAESFARSLQRIVAAVTALGTVPAALAACTSSNAADPAAPSQTATAEIDAGPPDPCAPTGLRALMFEEAGSTCATFVNLACGLPEGGVSTGCSLDPVTCKNACQTDLLFGCSLWGDSCVDGGAVPGASLVVDCVVCANGIGRRPRGLRAPRAGVASPLLGAYFARIAHLEAASVTAFRDLRTSLDSFAAPRGLRHATTRAIADERRHARITARLARRFGGRPARPRVAPVRAPSLAEVLADNVVEGCVGEAYGALVALWQAEHAGDERVRRAMRVIARDEARHASFAWRLLRWGATRVGGDGRKELARTLEEALVKLRATAEREESGAVEWIAGHPSAAVSRALVAEFETLVRASAQRALQQRSAELPG